MSLDGRNIQARGDLALRQPPGVVQPGGTRCKAAIVVKRRNGPVASVHISSCNFFHYRQNFTCSFTCQSRSRNFAMRHCARLVARQRTTSPESVDGSKISRAPDSCSEERKLRV